MEMHRLASSTRDLLSTSTTRDRISSPTGPEEHDKTHKQQNSQETLYNHQSDSAWNDTSTAENTLTYLLIREMEKATYAQIFFPFS